MKLPRRLAGALFRQSARRSTRPATTKSLALEPLEPRIALAAAGLVPVGAQPAGSLSGKIVYTSGGHGWQYSETLGRYATDRGDNNEIVEDFGNQEQMTAYVDYLFRAGATVVPMRPVGRQTSEVVLDNDSPGVTFAGAWSNSTQTRYYDEDYGASPDAVPYRFANTTTGAETSTATYTPNIPAAGMYPVYAWVLRGTDRNSQRYEINHTGGQTQVRVDHRLVGSGWVYLGTYHFNAGSSSALGSVQIGNQVPSGGGVVIADAIRFGNGMGDYVHTGAPGISGYPREDENSLHWIARSLGVGTTLSQAASTGNVSAPSNFAEWMNADTNPFGSSLYVSFHSNAGGGRGAVGLIDADAGDRTPHQADLATYLGRQINQDMQSLNGQFEFNWSDRTVHTFTGQFGEIDLGTSAEMDATIIEVAFHDSAEDAAIMRDPKGRDQLGRSTYQGTLEYFQNWGGLASPVSVATPPANVRALSNSPGAVTVSWSAGPTTPAGANGAAATGYRVYASSDGYGFDGGTFVAGGGTSSLTLTGYDATLPYYFRVVAVNAGGESKPSEVATALPTGGVKQVLIVNGFDRFDRTQDFRYAYAHTGDGLVDRVWPRQNNSFDYVVHVHTAINAARPGVHVASTSNEAVISGAVNLGDYDTVIWILGTESTVNDTFNATEQTKVSQFIAAGGNLFVSGSEIAWDLDSQNNGRTFFENTLKGNFVADDANTNTAVQVGGGIFAGLNSFVFSSGAASTGANAYATRDTQLYNVTSPDVIAAQPGAVVALNYNNGTGPAAIQVDGLDGAGNIVMFGFPFETMSDATRRQQAIGRIFDFFSLSAPAPAIDIKTQVNLQDADVPPGPVLGVGGLATFAYEVVNTGNVPLSGVVVKDDNGTPGNPADDFSPFHSRGDADGDGLLDEGETWIYLAHRSVVVGQFSNLASVAAEGNLQTVTDGDGANYFGVLTAVDVEVRVNGEVADSPTGPFLAVGGTATFTYEIVNVGTVAVGAPLVRDDRGTPADQSDDIIPTFDGGDADGDGLLDVGETWTYSAQRIVIAGQYSSGASFIVQSSVQSLIVADTVNYFGAAPAIDVKTLISGQDADSPTGPILAAGSAATFTYEVTNTGNVSLSGVVVMDDDATQGNPADDFSPTFVGGDADGDGLLDVGETWSYSVAKIVTAGQYSSIGSVTAFGMVQSVADNDPANYFGSAPAITIQARINGNNADSPPGPTRNAGDPATFIYIVRNAGNVPLGAVAVVDDNGTPNDSADDFSPAIITGDANANTLLDLSEIWLYLAFRAIAIGQHTNLATAQGVDSINQLTLAVDPVNYVGLGPAAADFDSSGLVDGRDFLAWQRGYGLAGAATLADGDATTDQTVDDADFAMWMHELPAAHAAAAIATVVPTFTLADADSAPGQSAPSAAASVERQHQVDPAIDPRQLWRTSLRSSFIVEQDAPLPPRERPASEPSSDDWAESVDQALDLFSEAVWQTVS